MNKNTPVIEERADGTFRIRRYANPIRNFLWETAEDPYSWILSMKYDTLEAAREAVQRYNREWLGEQTIRTHVP